MHNSIKIHHTIYSYPTLSQQLTQNMSLNILICDYIQCRLILDTNVFKIY